MTQFCLYIRAKITFLMLDTAGLLRMEEIIILELDTLYFNGLSIFSNGISFLYT